MVASWSDYLQTLDTMGFLYMAVSIASLGGLVFGYSIGVIAGAILYIRQEFSLSPGLEEVVVSGVLFGAMFGAGVGGKVADEWGRRQVLVLAAVVSVVGASTEILAPSVTWLIVGRIVVGFAFGILSGVTPLYIAEVSPANARGRLVSVNTVVVMVGILLSFIVDYVFSTRQSWRWMFGVGIFPAALLAIGMMALPRSPRWLLTRGLTDEARAALTRFRGSADVEEELRSIQASTSKQGPSWTELMRPQLRMALVVGIGLAIIRQGTGANMSTFYAPEVFRLAGFGSAAVELLGTMGVGACYVVMTFAALWLVDRVGRRPLMLWGLAGMIVPLAILALVFSSPDLSGLQSGIAVTSFLLFVCAFSIGPSGVVFLLISEIYPLNIRGLAVGVANFAMWGSYILTSLTFLTFIEVLGRSGTFWFYSFTGLAAWIFVYKLVPETKGRSLEEIEAHWARPQASMTC